MGVSMAIWDFDDERANFLDVLEMAAESGPQVIKRGGRRVYVVSGEDWLRARTGEMGHVDARLMESRGMDGHAEEGRHCWRPS
jgi:hypothetical protein